MTRTSFDFSLEIVGGRALLGAIRDVAAQVATYAGGKAVATAVADEVVTAAEAAIAAGRGQGGPITFRFQRSSECLDVYVTCTHAPTLAATHLSRGPGLSVDWQVVGAQQVCHIRQAMA